MFIDKQRNIKMLFDLIFSGYWCRVVLMPLQYHNMRTSNALLSRMIDKNEPLDHTAFLFVYCNVVRHASTRVKKASTDKDVLNGFFQFVGPIISHQKHWWLKPRQAVNTFGSRP
jgi:hypothetical protein